MKYIFLIIGIGFFLGVNAQNYISFEEGKKIAQQKKVKVSRLKAGFGIEHDYSGVQKESNKNTLKNQTGSNPQEEAIIESKSGEIIVRKSYYKAGFKVGRLQTADTPTKASQITE